MILELAMRFGAEIRAVYRMCDDRTFYRYLWHVAVHSPEIVRTRRIEPVDRAMTDPNYHLRIAPGKVMRIRGEDFGLAKEIYGRRCYFALPGFSIAPSDTVVDLGANSGVFSVGAALLGARVIAVEAQAGMLPLIAASARDNGCANRVRPLHALVGASTGLFASVEAREAASHWGAPPPTMTVPQLFAQHALERVDFLKIDIEGSEFGLFSERCDWLAIARRLVMEVHTAYGDVDELHRVLREAGFAVWLVDNRQRVVQRLTGKNGYLYAMHAQPFP